MATIDIDLDDFDADDLIEGLISKLNWYALSDREKRLAKKLNTILSNKLGGLENVHSDNLADQMKVEYLLEIKDRYTEADLRLALGFWEFKGKPTTY